MTRSGIQFFQSATRAMVVLSGLMAAVSLLAQNNDPDAGSWRMILLSGPAQVPVAAPAAVTDPGYVAELAAIKSAQGQITSDQRKQISYWSAGGVQRWNEIMISLVAEFDLPPEPKPDGSYPFPSAAKPFAIPQFPFANPPYASRAYSNVSVALYDALKAAWYFKYLYNRPAPSKVDSGVQALAPATGLPAYPSEDAVEAGAASKLLKILFPVEAAKIDINAAQQQEAALLAGKASASDIAAGFALGQAIGALVAKRAATDGLKAATGTPAQWQEFADAATARGEVPWKSQETPPRPPMLPFFSKAATWMMTPADIVKERPGPPPSTHSDQMAKELATVKQTVDNVTRDQIAIAYKWADGASSPTPPGHWNLIAAPYLAQAHFSEVRAARTYALLNMAMHDAAVACWDVKYTYFNPRPSQLDHSIKVIIPLPNFPSYTSGHSTFSAAAAEVLSYIFPSGASYFQAQSDEAAISRLYAGIHYPSDIEVGKSHGVRIGGYTLRFAKQDGADESGSLPKLNAAVVDSASYRPAVTPGGVATIFAASLGAQPIHASAVPLPTSLGGVSMRFNGFIPAPLFFASAGQANIQIPWELEGLSMVNLSITDAKGSSGTLSLPLAAFAPSIFAVNQGTSQGLVTIANTDTIAAPSGSIPGGDSRPAVRGDYVTIYCLGLGEVNHTPVTGQATPDSSSTTKSAVSVLLDGAALAPSFAGLTPGAVGLYQVNVRIPATAPSGNAITLELEAGGVKSNTVIIAIQ